MVLWVGMVAWVVMDGELLLLPVALTVTLAVGGQ